MSGYLLAERENVDIGYCERKMLDVIGKLCGWTLFFIVVHFIRTNEIYDFWDNFAYGLAPAGGILPVSWFLFTYCLLMILGYPLLIILKRYPKVFITITCVWTVALAIGIGQKLTISKPQSLWLHLYIGYFMLGMSFPRLIEHIVWILKKQQMLIAGTIFVICSGIYALVIVKENTFQFPHIYYGTWFYTLWVLALFWLCTLIRIDNQLIQKCLKRLSSGTFVVYLGHLPILLFITQYYPLKSIGMAIVLVVLLFVGLIVFAEILKRMPLLRKLV